MEPEAEIWMLSPYPAKPLRVMEPMVALPITSSVMLSQPAAMMGHEEEPAVKIPTVPPTVTEPMEPVARMEPEASKFSWRTAPLTLRDPILPATKILPEFSIWPPSTDPWTLMVFTSPVITKLEEFVL